VTDKTGSRIRDSASSTEIKDDEAQQSSALVFIIALTFHFSNNRGINSTILHGALR
jgi:hypothetical protein